MLSSGVVTSFPSIPITFMENWGKGDMETWCWITYHPLQNRTLNLVLCVFNDIAFGEGTLVLSVETKTRGIQWLWMKSLHPDVDSSQMEKPCRYSLSLLFWELLVNLSKNILLIIYHTFKFGLCGWKNSKGNFEYQLQIAKSDQATLFTAFMCSMG